MSRSVSRFSVSLCLFLALAAGCGPPPLKAEVDVLKENNLQTQKTIAELQQQLREQAAHLENVEREWWSDKFCNGGKNSPFAGKIAEFIGQVKARVPGTCTAENLESALIFMNNEPYAMARFKPNGSAEDLHLSRRGYLQKLLAPKSLHPSTRLLVLVQPAEETEAAQNRALALGTEYVALLRKEFLTDPKLLILGPHLLPCRLKAEIGRLYRSPFDKPLPYEPREGTPQINVWTFRSDC